MSNYRILLSHDEEVYYGGVDPWDSLMEVEYEDAVLYPTLSQATRQASLMQFYGEADTRVVDENAIIYPIVKVRGVSKDNPAYISDSFIGWPKAYLHLDEVDNPLVLATTNKSEATLIDDPYRLLEIAQEHVNGFAKVRSELTIEIVSNTGLIWSHTFLGD